jgi:hypothetical protein
MNRWATGSMAKGDCGHLNPTAAGTPGSSAGRSS